MLGTMIACLEPLQHLLCSVHASHLR